MSPSVERNNQSHCLWRLVNLLEYELLYTAQKNYRISLIFYKSWQFPATQRLLPNAARAELDFLQMRTKATTSGSEEIPTRNQQLISSTISSDWIAVTVNAALLGSLRGSHVHLIVDFTNRQKKKNICVFVRIRTFDWTSGSSGDDVTSHCAVWSLAECMSGGCNFIRWNKDTHTDTLP